VHAAIILVLVFLALNWSEDDPVTTKPSNKKEKTVELKKNKIKNTEELEKLAKKVKEIKEVESVVQDDLVEPELEMPELEEPIAEEVTAEVSLDDIKVKDTETNKVVETDKEDLNIAVEPVKDETVEVVDLSEEISSLNEETKIIDEVEQPAIAPSQEVDIQTSREDKITDTISNEEIIDDQVVQSDLSTDITKQLLKDLEVKLKEEKKELQLVEVLKPVTAPSYETIGRGLVYNCKGGHWACIENEGYKECRQNYSWNKSKNIPSECYPFAVLDNELDCAAVQQEKIDAVSDTNFCK
jgi:hypothetical protein